MRPLLPDSCGGAREAAGAEGFFVDQFDGVVMGGVFGQVDEVMLFHEEAVQDATMCDETGAPVHAGGLELHRGRRSWVILPVYPD